MKGRAIRFRRLPSPSWRAPRVFQRNRISKVLIMRTEMALLTLSIAGAIAATAGLLMATYLS